MWRQSFNILPSKHTQHTGAKLLRGSFVSLGNTNIAYILAISYLFFFMCWEGGSLVCMDVYVSDRCSAAKRLIFAVCPNCLSTLFFEAGLPSKSGIHSPIQLEWLASKSALLPPCPQCLGHTSAHATTLLLHEYRGFKLRS